MALSLKKGLKKGSVFYREKWSNGPSSPTITSCVFEEPLGGPVLPNGLGGHLMGLSVTRSKGVFFKRVSIGSFWGHLNFFYLKKRALQRVSKGSNGPFVRALFNIYIYIYIKGLQKGLSKGSEKRVPQGGLESVSLSLSLDRDMKRGPKGGLVKGCVLHTRVSKGVLFLL
jgi:hypothetical protein